jgi:hypothetical protein
VGLDNAIPVLFVGVLIVDEFYGDVFWGACSRVGCFNVVSSEVFKTFSSGIPLHCAYYLGREVVLGTSKDPSQLIGLYEAGKSCQGDKVEA